MNPKVDSFISNAKKWGKELAVLRKIILDCGLTEDFKWWQPCYSFQGANIVIMGELKDSCVLGFFKGALLQDPDGVLIQQTENSNTSRIIKFTSVREVTAMAPVLKAYIYEAIEVERAGLKIPSKKVEEFTIPEELQQKMDEMPAFKAAFNALTPGRQRGYLLYFSAPKQSKTRISRIEKYMQQILGGKGLND
ncbi:YdeI/OmpD-associated family protein [Chitinophaga sp. YIM B06452]|uniref:YdeI/OmpD-associated family protein n=1 Tax=Chitinophaga sp. YIM B06452 TaxID=3082158 RepID=UPI0031FE77C0